MLTSDDSRAVAGSGYPDAHYSTGVLPPFNSSTINIPFPVTVMKPFVPFHTQQMRNGPFDPKTMWKAAVGGVRSVQQLASKGQAKRSVSPPPKSKSPGLGSRSSTPALAFPPVMSSPIQDFLVVSGHAGGHMLLWDVDKNTLIGSCEHFNNATVTQIVVTTTYIYTVVEKVNSKQGQSGDDVDIYVWHAGTLQLEEKLAAHDDRVTCISVDDENELRFVSAGTDRHIFVWDLSVDTTKPVGRLEGHSSSVTKLRLVNDTVVSGGGDGEVRLWSISGAKCLHFFEGHQGQITTLDWLVKPTQKNSFQGLLCSTCNGGLVRGWDYIGPNDDEETQASMAQRFFNKSHKASVSDICWTDDIVISCSTADGINFFNTVQKTNFKVAAVESGVRCLALDPDRQLLIAGTDRGQLLFFDYANFVRPTRFHEDPVTQVASIHPHTGSITTLMLERGQGTSWSRVLSTSSDSTVFKIDFELSRDSKMVGTLTTNQCILTNHNSLLLPIQGGQLSNGAGVTTLYDPCTMTPQTGTRKKTEGKPGSRVVAMQFSTSLNLCVVATDDALVRSYALKQFRDDDMDSTLEEMLDPNGEPLDLSPYIVREMSAIAASGHVALGMQRGAISRAGYVTIIESCGMSHTCDTVTVPLPIINIALHAFSKSSAAVGDAAVVDAKKPMSFAVLVQLRNGEIQLLTCSSDSRNLQVLRVLVREQVGSALSGESSIADMSQLHWPMPCKFISTLNTKFEPTRVGLIYPEGMRTLRSIEASTGHDNAIPSQFTAVYNFDVIQVLPIHQGIMHYVVVVDHSTAYLTGAKCEPLFEVHYDGDVVDCSVSDASVSSRPILTGARKRRSLIMEESATASEMYYSKRFPACCSVSFSQELRMAVFGYRDGLIQIWDAATRRITNRIVAHGSPVVATWLFGDQRKLLSCATSALLRVDTIWPKTLRDARNNTSPTPAVTPMAYSLPHHGAHLMPGLSLS